MKIKHIALILCAAMAASPTASAQSPATYEGMEGTISLTFPPGWRRLDSLWRERFPEMLEKDTEFEADHGDAIRGEPGVVCTMKTDKEPLPSHLTAAAANASFRANSSKLPPPRDGEIKTVTTNSPGVEIETRILNGKRNDMVLWQALYAKDRTLYKPNMRCTATNVKVGLKTEYADLVTAMTSAMRYKAN